MTQSENVARQEQEFQMKLRHSNIINEKAFRENEVSGKASLNWQECAENFAQRDLEQSKQRISQGSDTEEQSASP